MAVQNNRACEDAAFPESKRRAPLSARPRSRRGRHDSLALSQWREFLQCGKSRAAPPVTTADRGHRCHERKITAWADGTL